MKTPDLKTLENLILLRSTGELSAAEMAELTEHLQRDPEAAAFAEFIAGNLPGRAPRDFAAEAIRAAGARQLPPAGVVSFPVRRWLGAAAVAAVFVLGFMSWKNMSRPHPGEETAIAAVSPPRRTKEISQRLATLESELASTQLSMSRGRYHRTATPL